MSHKPFRLLYLGAEALLFESLDPEGKDILLSSSLTVKLIAGSLCLSVQVLSFWVRQGGPPSSSRPSKRQPETPKTSELRCSPCRSRQRPQMLPEVASQSLAFRAYGLEEP